MVWYSLTPRSTTSTISSESEENIAREMMCSVVCIIATATSTTLRSGSASHRVEQFLRDFGHDRRVAGDAARVEGGRHDAAVAAPQLPVGGDQAAPEPRLQDAAAELRLPVVLCVVQQHMPHAAWFVDDEGAAPQQPAGNEILVEVLGRVGGKYVVADDLQELPQAHAPFRPARGGKRPGLPWYR